MKKFSRLKIITLVSILTVALVFIGFNLLQAQGKGKKPKPPGKGNPQEVYWSVIIPDTEGNMLYGMTENGTPHEYVSNEKDWVSVQKLGYKDKGTKGFYYQINFYIYQPNWVGFRYVDFYSYDTPDDVTRCAFPSPCDNPNNYSYAKCMACFMNQTHPQPDYSHIRVYFVIYDFEIESLEVGQKVDLAYAGYKGHYGFSVWYSSECSPDLPYHNIISSVNSPPRGDLLYGLYIERTDENIWRISVDKLDLIVEEIYCEEETGHGRNQKRVFRVPLTGTGEFHYQMNWIKNIAK
ncbi:MAG: hypothetical protein ACE5GI_00385 [Candidatus Aminicenantales bacterium]